MVADRGGRHELMKCMGFQNQIKISALISSETNIVYGAYREVSNTELGIY